MLFIRTKHNIQFWVIPFSNLQNNKVNIIQLINSPHDEQAERTCCKEIWQCPAESQLQ